MGKITTDIINTQDIKVEQINTYLGAQVTGLNLSSGLNNAQKIELENKLAEFEVLIFRDQPMTGDQLLSLGKKFGKLSAHPFSPNDEKEPSLILFKNDENNPPWKTDVWHSDETFREVPPFATMLHALDVPKFGGDTIFTSMTAAYEGLSDKMQHFLSGLEAYHDFIVFKNVFGETPEGRNKLQEYERDYPPSLHPVIANHPITRKKLIFVNPQFTVRIKGMDDTESQQLLNQLYDLTKIPEYQYRHHWTNNTLVIWDNRSTQHYAVHDYFPKKRYMQRVTISGHEAPQNAFTSADVEHVRNRKTRTPSELLALHGGHTPKKVKG
jgi:taurine dioxygenase